MLFNITRGTDNTDDIAAMLSELESRVSESITALSNQVTALKSDVATLSGSVTTVGSNVTALNTNVNSKFTTLTSTVNSKPTVKSVQRGILPAGTQTTKYDVLSVSSGVNWAYYVDVTINAVTNLNKCFVYTDSVSLVVPKLVNATTLRLYINSGSGEYTSYFNGYAVNWQVIEFY